MTDAKKELDINISVNYKNDNIINNGFVTVINNIPATIPTTHEAIFDLNDIFNLFKHMLPANYTIDDYINENIDFQKFEELGFTYNTEAKTFTKTYSVDCKLPENESLNFDKIRNLQSTLSPYELIKSYIMKNKDNQDVIRETVSNLLDDLESHYDHKMKHMDLPHASETFSNVLNLEKEEEMPGLICGTIHQQVMTALNECGIEACCITGGGWDMNHMTLMYKEADGKYIFNNYGSQLEIKANNIKDALKVLNKNNHNFNAVGYYSLQDNNVLFQEYAYKEESVYGEKMDKSDYNNETIADFSVASRPAINTNIEVANLGFRGEIGGRMVFSNENSNSELSANFAYQQKGETSNFVKSRSYGADVTFKKSQTLKNGDEFQFSANGVVTNVKGERAITELLENPYIKIINDALDNTYSQFSKDLNTATNGDIVKIAAPAVNYTSNPLLGSGLEDKKSDTSLFMNIFAGRKTNLLSTDNLEVDNTFKATTILSGTIRDKLNFSGDMRVALEDGITINNKVGDVKLSNTASVGIVDDLNLSLGSYAPKLQLGSKFNLASSAEFTPSDNSVFGGQARGYAVVTDPATELGVSASIFGQQKLNNSKSVVFGNASIAYENQKLHMTNFNETTENNFKLGVTAGIKVNPTTQISASYNHKFDKLNATNNYKAFNLTFSKTF